MADICFSDEKK